MRIFLNEAVPCSYCSDSFRKMGTTLWGLGCPQPLPAMTAHEHTDAIGLCCLVHGVDEFPADEGEGPPVASKGHAQAVRGGWAGRGLQEEAQLQAISDYFQKPIPEVPHDNEDRFIEVLKEAGLTDG